jgi:hypothetical protein
MAYDPRFVIVDGELSGNLFKIKTYPSLKDLCNPTIKPSFVCRAPNQGVPDELIVICILGEPDDFYKADPRNTDLLREWVVGKQFPDFRPVYQVQKIGRNNRLARYARMMVHQWIKNEFTFLQTEAQPQASVG